MKFEQVSFGTIYKDNVAQPIATRPYTYTGFNDKGNLIDMGLTENLNAMLKIGDTDESKKNKME